MAPARTRTPSTSTAAKAKRSLQTHASEAGQALSTHTGQLLERVQGFCKQAHAGTSRGAVKAKDSIKAHPIATAAATAAIGAAVMMWLKRRHK